MRGTDFSNQPSGKPGVPPTTEQARLDDAMRRADDLLVTSLKTDERRRVRRNRILLSIGGLAMFATVCFLLVSSTMQSQIASNAAAGNDQSGALAQEGWQLWQGRNFVQAAEKFEQAVKLAPKNTSAWNGLGWSRFNSGQQDAAEKAFKKVIALEPKHPAALNGLGQLALLRRNYKDAEKYLLKAAPQASAAWYGLARLYLLEGKFNDAKKWAKKVVDSGEANDLAKEMLEAAEEKKLTPELREQIEPPASASGEGSSASNGWPLFFQGRNAEAKEAFEKALAANPSDRSAQNGLGWCLLNSGQTSEAKPYFEKVIAADPNAAGALNGLANVLAIEGDLDGAVKIWEDLVERFPAPDASAPYELADAYLEKGELAKALPLLEKPAQENPSNEQLKAKLARAREKAGK